MPAPAPCTSPAEHTRHGLAHYTRGDLQRAARAFAQAAAASPDEPLCWNNLAMAQADLGDAAAAEAALRRSLTLDAGQAQAWTSLANLLSRQERYDAAVAAFEAALALDAASPFAWRGLGLAQIQREAFAAAAEALGRAIALGADEADLHLNLGVSRLKSGRFEAARPPLARAVSLAPASAAAREVLRLCDFLLAAINADMAAAMAVYPAGAFNDPPSADRLFKTALLYLDWAGLAKPAGDVAEAWVARRPDNVEAAHLRDAALSRPAPRQPAALVAQHFDGIAEDFDARLVTRLGYRGPQQLAALISSRLTARADLDVLDLGCGTGLCGAVLRPYARRLEGVDLSPGMLAKAAARGDYDQLRVADILARLEGQAAAWDLLVAADSFPYLGDLAPVVAGAWAALRPGGWFAFTTETTDRDGYRLLGNGRYAHGPAYLRRLAEGRFEISDQVTGPLRREGGGVVEGDAWLLRRID